jgi:hypothetical protein
MGRSRQPRKSKLQQLAEETEAKRLRYAQPTELSLKLDKARLAYHWARLNGLSLEPFLKAWAVLLHVPKTRVTNGS